jgi:hypothetical protein
MTRATPISDEQLFELLRRADPLADSGPSSTVVADAAGVEGDRLLQRILSSERVSTPRPGWRRAQRRRRLILSVTSGGGVAAAVVAGILVFTAGNAPSVAFAGWSANPTMPASGQVQAAEAKCQRNSALTSLAPTLADTRGPDTLIVYAETSGGLCLTGRSLQSATGGPALARFRSHGVSSTAVVAPDAIRGIDTGLIVMKASVPEATLSFNVGRVGANVTAVTLVLRNGGRVEATTSNGWFAAWWPGGVEAQPGGLEARAAEITTTSGLTTQQLIPAATPSAPAPGQQGAPIG